jgi:hypothetical protein
MRPFLAESMDGIIFAEWKNMKREESGPCQIAACSESIVHLVRRLPLPRIPINVFERRKVNA